MATHAHIENDILIRQDGESIFPILQARQYRWRVAERWQITQLVITVFIPAIMTVIALLVPWSKSAISMFAVLITFFDVGLIDRQYRKAIKTAARMSELMDIRLFRLPWNKLAAGDEPPPENVNKSARQGKAMKRDHRWKGWYSREIGPVPFAIARTICQRTNIEYDSDLRRTYILILQILLVVAFALAAVIGMALQASLANFVLSGLVPASPLVVWALREQFRQKDAVEGYAPVRAEAEKILSAAVAGKQSGAELDLDSRLLQNAIFLRRATTVLLLPGIYKMRRPAAEEAMHDGAKYWVDRWCEETGAAPVTDQSA